jgi:hypothetical protein
LQFLIKKKLNFFFSCTFFFNFWSLKPWIRIGSGSGLVPYSAKMLDPDPDEMNAGIRNPAWRSRRKKTASCKNSGCAALGFGGTFFSAPARFLTAFPF